jgi:hypothetical protein
MNMLWEYGKQRSKHKFCDTYYLHRARCAQVQALILNLRRRVAAFLCIDESCLVAIEPPGQMPSAKLVLLRALHVLAFPDNVIVQKAWKNNEKSGDSPATSFTVLFDDNVEAIDLEQILDPEVHSFAIQSPWSCQGYYCPVDGVDANVGLALLSFASEKDLGFVSCSSVGSGGERYLFVRSEMPTACGSVPLLYESESQIDIALTKSRKKDKSDNRSSRPCGTWSASSCGSPLETHKSEQDIAFWTRFNYSAAATWKSDFARLQQLHGKDGARSNYISFKAGDENPTKKKTATASTRIPFHLDGSCQKMSNQDLKDLFSTPYVTERNGKNQSGCTSVTFPIQNPESTTALLSDLPEAVRTIGAVLSGRFRGSVINFANTQNAELGHYGVEGEDFREVKVSAKDGRGLKVQFRWNRLEEKNLQAGERCTTYLSDVFSVPAGACQVNSSEPLFACASHCMEMQGGAARFSGLTIISSGAHFVELAFLCFGLSLPSTRRDSGSSRYQTKSRDVTEWEEKKEQAKEFFTELFDLDAEIRCCPLMVVKLLSVFDESPWPALERDVNS